MSDLLDKLKISKSGQISSRWPASHVKSQVNDFQIQIKSRVISLNNCCGLYAVILAENLTNHKKYLIMIVFGAACHSAICGLTQVASHQTPHIT